MSEPKLAEVTIVIQDREKSACTVNELLTEYGDFIIARMGVPHREKKMYIISIVLEASAAKIDELVGKLSGLSSIRVKSIAI